MKVAFLPLPAALLVAASLASLALPGGASPLAAPAPPPAAAPTPAPAAARAAADFTDAQVAAVAPPLGFQSGINPTGTGNCDGAVDGADGSPIKIPCDCPPDEDVYIAQLTANANAGVIVKNPSVAAPFPLDDSLASQLTRLSTAAATLQNLDGIGVGCPIESTTFVAQQDALQAPGPPPSSAPASVPPSSAPASVPPSSAPASIPPSTPASPPPTTAPTPPPSQTSVSAPPPTSTASAPAGPGVPDNATIAALTPDLGFTAGINPKGDGNCDGAVDDSTGQPIQVPCSCPPDRDTFVEAVIANVDAGHAVNNPNVAVQFPTDDSQIALIERLQTAIITLQNMDGSGKGCPASSTTLSAQLAAALG